MTDLLDLARETFRGKSLSRILQNQALRDEIPTLSGRVLDIGGGGASYGRYVRAEGAELVTTNLDAERNPSVVHDFNTPFPMPDGSFDAILLFNTVYILKDPSAAAREIFRVLKPGGAWYILSPFIFQESPEPDDFRRLTSQGLRLLAEQAGFRIERLAPIGGRFAAAEQLIDPILRFAPLQLPVRLAAVGLDRLVGRRLSRVHPAPLSYFISAKKPA